MLWKNSKNHSESSIFLNCQRELSWVGCIPIALVQINGESYQEFVSKHFQCEQVQYLEISTHDNLPLTKDEVYICKKLSRSSTVVCAPLKQ